MSSEKNNNDLKKIRRDKGLTVEQVANELKLTADVINKLENSDFKALGAYTYVRGYINNYTKLLEIEAQPYLELVPKSDFIVPLVNTHASNTKSIKLKRHSKNMASYMIGTFVVLAISFSGWFLLKNYTAHEKNNSNQLANKDNLEIKAQDNSSLSIPSIHQKPDEKFHLSSIIPTENSNDETNNNQTTETTSATTELSTNNTETQNQATTENSVIENTAPENPTAEDSTTTSEQKINQLAYEITIKANATSWVKVEEIDGKKLHNDLLKPGSITLHSDNPIHFRIGNGSEVSIQINGQTIDLSKFSRKNIVDFKWPLES